jgi:hypothetical protein
MKRSSVRTLVWIATALSTMFVPGIARGDGGIVLLHETKDPFSVTVFVSPEGARGGLADVSVLVQWRKNGEVILDADVILALDPPAGVVSNQSDPLCGVTSSAAAFPSPELTQHQVKAHATRGQASNKLLYAAPLALNTTGDWRLHMLVSRGSDSAGFDCLVPVTITSAKLSGLWPYLAFPPIVITAFALNQRLRRHSLEKGVESQSRSSQFT